MIRPRARNFYSDTRTPRDRARRSPETFAQRPPHDRPSRQLAPRRLALRRVRDLSQCPIAAVDGLEFLQQREHAHRGLAAPDTRRHLTNGVPTRTPKHENAKTRNNLKVFFFVVSCFRGFVIVRVYETRSRARSVPAGLRSAPDRPCRECEACP